MESFWVFRDFFLPLTTVHCGQIQHHESSDSKPEQMQSDRQTESADNSL